MSTEAPYAFVIRVEEIADDAHLSELIDAINAVAYVADVQKVS